jgi:Tol biopolymer transport system component
MESVHEAWKTARLSIASWPFGHRAASVRSARRLACSHRERAWTEAGRFHSSRWLADGSDKLFFTALSRDFRRVDVCVADTSTGTPKTLMEERSNVWLDVRPLRLAAQGSQLIWWSERDGWAHYYLYDTQGKLKTQITSGEYMAGQIVSVDDKANLMFFTANGHEANENPYYSHLYRVGLDGTGLKLLTPGNFSHGVSAPDSGKFFVDTYSRVDTAPYSSMCKACNRPTWRRPMCGAHSKPAFTIPRRFT